MLLFILSQRILVIGNRLHSCYASLYVFQRLEMPGLTIPKQDLQKLLGSPNSAILRGQYFRPRARREIKRFEFCTAHDPGFPLGPPDPPSGDATHSDRYLHNDITPRLASPERNAQNCVAGPRDGAIASSGPPAHERYMAR